MVDSFSGSSKLRAESTDQLNLTTLDMAKKKTNAAASQKRSPKKTRKPATRSTAASSTTGPQRLQRVMASAGVGSRRECEIIIEEGRVEVDGQVVVTLGTKVDPEKQKISVDGERLKVQRLQYFMLNKPPGIVSTASDPSGRLRVIDLIKTNLRVYNVGRLDQSSEGMILVTNDGELANRLTHPRYGIEKKYLVQVDGCPSRSALRQLEEGMYLAAEGKHKAVKAKAVQVKFVKRLKSTAWLEIVLDEGRNREIRRLLARIGHKVRTLRRIGIGPLRLGEVPLGAHRELTTAELKALRKAVENIVAKKKKPVKKKAAKKKSTRSSDKTSDSKSAAAPETRRKGTVIGIGKKKKPKKATPKRGTDKKSAVKKKATKKKRKSTGAGRRGASAGKPVKKKKPAPRKKPRGKKR